MAEKRYYVRVRGRVMGPFGTSQLQTLRDRGQFRSFHEVSEDRQNWGNAARLTELFSGESRGSQFDSDDDDARPAKSAPEPPADAWFYVDASGRQQGPVSFGALQTMRSNGTLTSESMIWKNGWPEWRPLASVAASPATIHKTNDTPPLRAIDALPLFITDPVGGLPRLCTELSPRAAFGLGIAFYLLALLCFSLGVVIAIELTERRFVREFWTELRDRDRAAAILRLIVCAAIPLLSMTAAIGLIRLIARGRGNIGTDVLIASACFLPIGLAFPIAFLLGENVEVILFLWLFVSTLPVLILGSAFSRWIQLPDRGVIFAVPAAVIVSVWISKIIFVALLANKGADVLRQFG